MFQNNFNSNENILYTKWIRTISLEDVIKYLDLLESNAYLPRELLTLELFVDVELEFEVADLNTIAEKTQKTLPKFKTIHSALVFNQAMPSAYGVLYKNLTEAFSFYKVEVFSSQDVAKKWLLNIV
jgi:hypothetical protein